MFLSKGQIYGLIKMGRPFVLVAGLIAYFVGVSMAYYELKTVDVTKSVFGLLVLITGTLMGHYLDEYADVDTDTLTRRTLYSGGSGVLPLGIIPASWAIYCAIFFFFITLIITFASIKFNVLPQIIVFIVLPALFGGWIYSMPPFSLERKGFGELDNAILGGFFMTLVGYTAQTGKITSISILSLVPIFLAVFVNLLGVHWSDRIADQSVGKLTLVVKLMDKTRFLFYFLVFLTYFITLLFMGKIIPFKVGISILITIPFGVFCSYKFTRTNSPMLSSAFMALVMFAMIFGYLLA
ncbi:MAG: 1,4-dihydroxy-2-naphthoate octaprenyltransferase [Candidatus Methanofastidiosum methylothiophilum]|uniref:1,4-dihydroxy-2-naphthoate octaprenyltransferase n=1 Tax=Candidatus Methanofastidiosum methylothiophilum TaxID=1705564 RepID=A0A150IIA2_9EURY|nr:MAG: 1,4-dihydroxy-2-naphthoate octaprenyltransferase [Candidatus Methanofastidiosum methylthiophilus]